MNEIREKKIRFSDAANAVGVSRKALRNWMQRNKLHLASDYSGSGWTEFNLADIAILAVMRCLIRWGVSVDDANQIAFLVFMSKGGMLLKYRNTPAEFLPSPFLTFKIVVWGLGEEDGPYFRLGIKDEKNEAPADTFLTINIGDVISDALMRLQNIEKGDEEKLVAEVEKLINTIKSAT